MEDERFITTNESGRVGQTLTTCRTCNRVVVRFLLEDALKNGCPHCRHRALLEEEVPSHHKFYRGGDGPKSRWCLGGIWEAGEEPTKKKHAVRFVVMSDTHEMESKFGRRPLTFYRLPWWFSFSLTEVPPGDVLLHAGDFSMTGGLEPVKEFNEWLGKLPHLNKIVIAGALIGCCLTPRQPRLHL